MGHLEFHVKKNIINPSHSISRAYFRKAERVRGMNQNGLILVNVGQLKEENLNSMKIWSFWSVKMPSKNQKGHCVWIPSASF